MRAIVQGERDPAKLLELRDPQIRSTKEEIRHVLVGDWRPELLFVLEQSLKGREFYQEQMRACDLQIEAQLKRMRSSAPVSRPSAPPVDPLASSSL